MKQLLCNQSSSEAEFEEENVSADDTKPISAPFSRLRLSPLLHRFRRGAPHGISRTRFNSTSSGRVRHPSDTSLTSEFDLNEITRNASSVTITTMSRIAERRVKRHIGVLNLFIVRETTAVKGADEMLPMTEPDCGTGCNWFVARTLAETQALVRSHVMALGGNTLTSYRSWYVLNESLSKNEAHCLLHVIGDVVDLI